MKQLPIVAVAWSLLLAVPARADNTATHAPHWGGQLLPDVRPTQHASIQTMLLSEYGQPPRNATRRGDELLAPGYGALEHTYGLTLLSYGETGYMFVNSSRRSPELLYTLAASVGAVWDPFPSFLQNQFAHNTLGISPVPRDGDEPAGAFVAVGGELNYLLSPDTGQTEPALPVYIGSGVVLSSLLVDRYLQVGFGEFRPFRWGTFAPLFSWLSVHSALRAGYVGSGLGEVVGWDRAFPGLSGEHELKEFYAMYQLGAGIHVGLWYIPGIRVSLTGTTGIFLRANQEGRADREVPIPDNFISVSFFTGNWWFEFLNDLQGNKDSGPSYGARVGGAWPL